MTTTTPAKPSGADGGPKLPPRPAPNINSIGVVVVLVAILIGGIWSVNSIGINFGTIVDSIDNAVVFVDRMFPLDFPPLGESIYLIVETLAIVFLATLLSVLLSVPAAFFAAKQTTSGPGMRWFARATIVLCRAIPDLILAIVFLRLFGLGPLAGILAMGIHSVGMVGKLYADAIEELSDGPTEAVRTAGGTRPQQIHASIVVRLLPQIVATGLHRFDINLRTSVLLGYVGVGGIGQAISEALRTLNYQRGMALALIVLVLCIATEMISGMIRSALMRSSGGTTKSQLWSDKLIASVRGKKVQEAAAVSAESKESREQLVPPWDADRVNRFISYGIVILFTVLSLWQVEIRWGEFLVGFLDVPATLGLFFPPAGGSVLETVIEAMIVTVQIALAATLLGSILAVPVGILAAKNVTGNKYISGTFRFIIVVVRGIPELILAIVLIVISGLGPVAGTLALAIGAVGLLSKLLADSIEETEVGPQDAVRTNGASQGQVFFAATLRQSLPAFVAHIMYLLDTNIRSATLLGVVGAGGVGFLLNNASRVNQFDVVTTILLVMIAVVLVVEAISIWVRNNIR